MRHLDHAQPTAAPLVVVVDDEEDVRSAISTLLSAYRFDVAAYAGGEQLRADGALARAACLIIDVRLDGEEDGIELLSSLRAGGCHAPALIFTGHGDIPMAVRAMRAGATDFIEKPFAPDRLIAMINASLEANKDVPGGDERLRRLTPRQREVLDGLVAGATNKQVAIDLGISPRTVEAYRTSIMEKLEARSFADVVRIAVTAPKSDRREPQLG